MDEGGGPLVCPRCATPHAASERFCADCGLPLTYARGGDAEPAVSEAHARARKIKPQYSEGELMRVAGARHQAEAELIQGLLLEEGVPSVLRRTRGFDVPDFLAAGPRDVLVPEAGAEVARELLRGTQDEPPPGAGGRPNPVKLVAAIVLGGAGTALIAWLLQS
jgi:pimeloyl-ACP methyl ester carboxylesterase